MIKSVENHTYANHKLKDFEKTLKRLSLKTLTPSHL